MADQANDQQHAADEDVTDAEIALAIRQLDSMNPTESFDPKQPAPVHKMPTKKPTTAKKMESLPLDVISGPKAMRKEPSNQADTTAVIGDTTLKKPKVKSALDGKNTLTASITDSMIGQDSTLSIGNTNTMITNTDTTMLDEVENSQNSQNSRNDQIFKSNTIDQISRKKNDAKAKHFSMNIPIPRDDSSWGMGIGKSATLTLNNGNNERKDNNDSGYDDYDTGSDISSDSDYAEDTDDSGDSAANGSPDDDEAGAFDWGEQDDLIKGFDKEDLRQLHTMRGAKSGDFGIIGGMFGSNAASPSSDHRSQTSRGGGGGVAGSSAGSSSTGHSKNGSKSKSHASQNSGQTNNVGMHGVQHSQTLHGRVAGFLNIDKVKRRPQTFRTKLARAKSARRLAGLNEPLSKVKDMNSNTVASAQNIGNTKQQLSKTQRSGAADAISPGLDDNTSGQDGGTTAGDAKIEVTPAASSDDSAVGGDTSKLQNAGSGSLQLPQYDFSSPHTTSSVGKDKEKSDGGVSVGSAASGDGGNSNSSHLQISPQNTETIHHQGSIIASNLTMIEENTLRSLEMSGGGNKSIAAMTSLVEEDGIRNAFRFFWELLRIFVVLYLFMASSFRFGFYWNDPFPTNVLLMLIVDYCCDIFMLFNVYFEIAQFDHEQEKASRKLRKEEKKNLRLMKLASPRALPLPDAESNEVGGLARLSQMAVTKMNPKDDGKENANIDDLGALNDDKISKSPSIQIVQNSSENSQTDKLRKEGKQNKNENENENENVLYDVDNEDEEVKFSAENNESERERRIRRRKQRMNMCLDRIILSFMGSRKRAIFLDYREHHKLQFDFAVLFPFDLLALILLVFRSFLGDRSCWNVYITVRLLKCLHARRWFEYFKPIKVAFVPEKGIWRSAFIPRLARMCMVAIFWVHGWSCLWAWLGSALYAAGRHGPFNVAPEEVSDTWLTAHYARLKEINDGEFAVSNGVKYLWSMYFTAVTFSTVGYGDITPQNWLELILTIIYILAAFVFVSVLVAELAPLIEEFAFKHLQRGTQHRNLRNSIITLHLDRTDKDKLMEANRYRWRNQYGFEESEILNDFLPPSLSMEIKYEFLERSFLAFTTKVFDDADMAKSTQPRSPKQPDGAKAPPKLKDQRKYSASRLMSPKTIFPAALVRQLANKCKPMTFIEGQPIISQGVSNKYLYFIIGGTVVIGNPDEVNHPPEISGYPGIFGVETFYSREQYLSRDTYTATQQTSVFAIDGKDFRHVLGLYPDIKKEFEKKMKTAYPEKEYLPNAIRKLNSAEFQQQESMLKRSNAINRTYKNRKVNVTRKKFSSWMWDIVNGLCIIYYIITFIFGVLWFHGDEYGDIKIWGWVIANWVIDSFMIADIIVVNLSLEWNISYYFYFYPARSGKPRKQRNLQDTILDIISLAPFEIIVLSLDIRNNFMMAVYLCRATKLLRIRYMTHCWSAWVQLLRNFGLRSRGFKLAIYAVFFIHIGGCIWFAIGTSEESDSLSWFRNEELLDNGEFSTLALRSEYFLLITTATVGYGGIVPVSTREIMYAIFLVTIGALLYWTLISFFAMIASYSHRYRVEHTNLVNSTEYLLHTQHPSRAPRNAIIPRHRLSSKSDMIRDSSSGIITTKDSQSTTATPATQTESVVDDVFEAGPHSSEKEIAKRDEASGDDVFFRLQKYFDFVLHDRDGVPLLWNTQVTSIEEHLRYHLLTKAFTSELHENEENRHYYLQDRYIPKHIRVALSKKLKWNVICQGNVIKIAQRGPSAAVAFLVSGSLVQDKTQDICRRHAKDLDKSNEDRIPMINVDCLNPLSMARLEDASHNFELFHLLPRYLEVLVDTSDLRNIDGLYVIRTLEKQLTKEKYDVIYQRNSVTCTSDVETYLVFKRNAPEKKKLSKSDENETKSDAEDANTQYFGNHKPEADSEKITKDETVIDMSSTGQQKVDDAVFKDSSKQVSGTWMFVEFDVTYESNKKKILSNMKCIAAHHAKTDDPCLIPNSEWFVQTNEDVFNKRNGSDDSIQSNDRKNQLLKLHKNNKEVRSLLGKIFIRDELHFEASECCDTVTLYQRDFYEVFSKYRFQFLQYLEKAPQLARDRRRSSVLHRVSTTLGLTQSADGAKSYKSKSSGREKYGDNDIHSEAQKNVELLMSENKLFAPSPTSKHAAKHAAKKAEKKKHVYTVPHSAGNTGTIGRNATVEPRQDTIDESLMAAVSGPSILTSAKAVLDEQRQKGDGSAQQVPHGYGKVGGDDTRQAKKSILSPFTQLSIIAGGAETITAKSEEWYDLMANISDNRENLLRPFKIAWTFAGIVLTVAMQFILPRRAIFYNDKEYQDLGWDIVAQIYFLVDLYVRWKFVTKIELHRTSTKRQRYVDIFITLPWPWIGLFFNWELYYFFRLFALSRIFRLSRYWNDFRDDLIHYTNAIISVHDGIAAIAYHIFLLLLVANYTACAWYLLGEFEDDDQFSWTQQNSELIDNTGPYLVALYWSIVSMSSVGYGDVKPITGYESALSIVVLSGLVVFYVQFMGDVASFMSNLVTVRSEFEKTFFSVTNALTQRINGLNEDYEHEKIEKLIHWRTSIRAYLMALWKERQGVRESEIYDKLPYFLAREISYECRKKYLHQVECFEGLVESSDITDIELCKKLAFAMEHSIVTENDTLSLDRVFIIEKGELEQFIILDDHTQRKLGNSSNHNEDYVLKNGQSFGISGTMNNTGGGGYVTPKDTNPASTTSARRMKNLSQDGSDAFVPLSPSSRKEQRDIHYDKIDIELAHDGTQRSVASKMSDAVYSYFGGVGNSSRGTARYVVYGEYNLADPDKYYLPKTKLKCVTKHASIYTLTYDAIDMLKESHPELGKQFGTIEQIAQRCFRREVQSRDKQLNEYSPYKYNVTQSTFEGDANAKQGQSNLPGVDTLGATIRKDNKGEQSPSGKRGGVAPHIYMTNNSKEKNEIEKKEDKNRLLIKHQMDKSEELDEFNSPMPASNGVVGKSSSGVTGLQLHRDDVTTFRRQLPKHSYRLKYNKRTILRRSHPFRIGWDSAGLICLFCYSILFPFQLTNVFYESAAMWIGLAVATCIDIFFIVDLFFRMFLFAPVAKKKLNPLYSFIGIYPSEETVSKYKNAKALSDLPQNRTDLRAKYLFWLEIAALLPLNLLGIMIPALFSVQNMNVWFRLNKLLYVPLLFPNLNKTLNIILSQRFVSFNNARVAKFGAFTLLLVHWMACIWMAFARRNRADVNWLNSMSEKRIAITDWKDNAPYTYLLSLYFVAVTMTTTGYGDITPQTTSEIQFVNFLIILGDALMATIAGAFIQYIANLNQSTLDIAIHEKSIVTYLRHRTDLIHKQCVNSKEKLDMTDEELSIQRRNFDRLETRVKAHFEKQLNYRHTMGALQPFSTLPPFYYINILDAMFGEFFKYNKTLLQLENFGVIYPELLQAVREEVYTRDDNSWEFIIDPLTQQLDDFIIVQFGECEVYTKKDWYSAMHAKLDGNPDTRIRWPDPVHVRGPGEMIGFREFILRRKVHCVVIPSEHSQLISILRIPRNIFRQIIHSSIRSKSYSQFKDYVKKNVEAEVTKKDILASRQRIQMNG